MPAQAAIPAKAPSVSRTTSPVEELIRELAAQAAAEMGGPETLHDQPETVLLDIDVDGWRYLLMRVRKPDRPQVQLSPREQEIVRMVAQGHSNKVIADVLAISSWTVCTHLRRIFAKLGVGSRAAMVGCLLGTAAPPPVRGAFGRIPPKREHTPPA